MLSISFLIIESSDRRTRFILPISKHFDVTNKTRYYQSVKCYQMKMILLRKLFINSLFIYCVNRANIKKKCPCLIITYERKKILFLFYNDTHDKFLIDICFNLSAIGIEDPLRNSITFLLSHCVLVKLQMIYAPRQCISRTMLTWQVSYCSHPLSR